MCVRVFVSLLECVYIYIYIHIYIYIYIVNNRKGSDNMGKN